MRPSKSPFAEAAEQLSRALDRETRAARCGALAELSEAAAEKRRVFAEFQAVQPTNPCENISRAERDALQMLLAAANENAVVLEAVKVVLDSTASRLHELLSSVADPGVYNRGEGRARHVMAARINAIA